MHLQRLAAKHKRYLDVLAFAEHEVENRAIRAELLDALRSYKLALAQSWQKQSIEKTDEERLNSIERTLETLHNEARLLAHPTSGHAS